jgi:outer membrane protein TolC
MKNASEADLQETIENISYNVIQSYFSMLSAQESVAAAQETKMKMEKHLELAKAQLAAGIRQKIDVMRAQSDLASANLTLVQAKNALSLARLNLINAMGISKDLEFTVKSPENLAEIKSTSIDDAVRNALVKRPGYRSLKEKIQAAEGTLVAARSGYFPTIAASGNAGYTGYELNGLVYNWSAGLTMTWNFFSGFNTQNAVSEASANLSALQAELDKITLSIKNEVESAWINFSEAKEKIEPAEALLLSAEETLKMAEERYAAGAGNIVEVTDAQALYIQAKASRIQISYEFEIARAKFFKAVGAISEIMKGEN